MSGVDAKAGEDWLIRLDGPSEIRDLAIEQLRSYLVRGLRKSLTHRYGGRVDVDDVAQVAILRILDSLGSFAGRSKFETWALSIATRVGISELRKHYYKTVSLGALTDDDGVQFDFSDNGRVVGDLLEDQKSMIRLLQSFIEEKLTSKQRMAIRGTLAGLSVEVIAERLKSNRNAVYKLVHDARSKLKEEFGKAGVSPEDVLNSISWSK